MDAFLLDVNHDDLEAKLTSCEIGPEAIRSKEVLFEHLREENVLKGVDKEVIDEAFNTLASLEEEGVEFVIAQGQRPKPGENGKIDFAVNVSGEAVFETNKDDAGIVDFKNATHIVAVEEGQLLATITPPTKGTPGWTLTGKDIAARSGKAPMFRCGEGVELDADGKKAYATREGRPVFSHHVLSVSAIYEVRSDVSYETGNIKFNGHVLVHGNVQDEFTIKGKSVEIQGVIGAARIESEGDLVVRGGINGHEKATIHVGGDAFLKYVNQAYLEVQGNVIVQREIVNSKVWCSGKVTAKKIVGGECLALLGIEAQNIGSEIGVPTLVEPGINYEVRRIEQAMDVLSRHIQKAIKPVTTFFGDRARYLAVPDEKKAHFLEIYQQFRRLKKAYEKLLKGRRKLLDDDERTPIHQVVVLNRLYQDVTIKTDNCIKLYRVEVGGPAAILEDLEHSTFRVAAYNPSKGMVEEEEEEEEAEIETPGAMSASEKLKALGRG